MDKNFIKSQLEANLLYDTQVIRQIDADFIQFLEIYNIKIKNKLLEYRNTQGKNWFFDEEAQFLLELAVGVEKFLITYFCADTRIFDYFADIAQYSLTYQPIIAINKSFVAKKFGKIALKAHQQQADSLQWLQQDDARLTWFSEFYGEITPQTLYDMSPEDWVVEWRKLKWDKLAEQLQGLVSDPQEKITDLYDYELLLSRHIAEALRDNKPEVTGWIEAYCLWGILSHQGRKLHKIGLLLTLPAQTDPQKLIPEAHKSHNSQRITLHETNLPQYLATYADNRQISFLPAQKQAQYCIYCHKRAKDSCSHGMHQAAGQIRNNAQGVALEGCPLKQKISEMNQLFASQNYLAALAMAMRDNPLIAATGHRICNDCMKACIFQQQEPVDIPLIESQMLRVVLEAPWGLELYSLLTRWNPLRHTGYSPQTRQETSPRILIVGAGPAGFALAYYLLQRGYLITLIDAMKIEPLPQEAGRPIESLQLDFLAKINHNIAYGFGGVMQYGITDRWNKDLLHVIRLILQRDPNFKLYGSTHFASGFNTADARALGYDHVAIAIGAGRPRVLSLSSSQAEEAQKEAAAIVQEYSTGKFGDLSSINTPSNNHNFLTANYRNKHDHFIANSSDHILIGGVHTASDFLMALNLGSLNNANTLYNFELQIPAVVLGAGLTAVDVAAELGRSYIAQIKRFSRDFRLFGVKLAKIWTKNEEERAKIWLQHAEELQKLGPNPNPQSITALIKSWGGVAIIYRANMEKSPAYRLNHEELRIALNQGVDFIENTQIISVDADEYGCCRGLFAWQSNSDRVHEPVTQVQNEEYSEKTILAAVNSGNLNKKLGGTAYIPAKSVFLALGTEANTQFFLDDPDLKEAALFYQKATTAATEALKQGRQQQPDYTGINTKAPAKNAASVSSQETPQYTFAFSPGQYISYFGDLHPKYQGSVVKAIASAKIGQSEIADLLEKPSYKSNLKPIYRENNMGKSPTTAKIISEKSSRMIENTEKIDNTEKTENNLEFQAKIANKLTVKLINITQIAKNNYKLLVKAPMAASHWQIGQFFRAQILEASTDNYGLTSPINKEQQMEVCKTHGCCAEPVALTPIRCDKTSGIFEFNLWTRGASSHFLAQQLMAGRELDLMGPSGAALDLPQQNEGVICISYDFANALAASKLTVMRQERGASVLHLALHPEASDIGAEEGDYCSIGDLAGSYYRFNISYSLHTNSKTHETGVRSTKKDINDKQELFLNILAQKTPFIKEKAQKISQNTGAKFTYVLLHLPPELLSAAQQWLHESTLLAPQGSEPLRIYAVLHSRMQCMQKGVCGRCLNFVRNNEIEAANLGHSLGSEVEPGSFGHYSQDTARTAAENLNTARAQYRFFCCDNQVELTQLDIESFLARQQSNSLTEKLARFVNCA